VELMSACAYMRQAALTSTVRIVDSIPRQTAVAAKRKRDDNGCSDYENIRGCVSWDLQSNLIDAKNKRCGGSIQQGDFLCNSQKSPLWRKRGRS